MIPIIFVKLCINPFKFTTLAPPLLADIGDLRTFRSCQSHRIRGCGRFVFVFVCGE